MLTHQPLLTHAVPWRTPLRRDPFTDVFHHEQPGAVLVAAPVLGPRYAEGRYELLRAEPVRAGATPTPGVVDTTLRPFVRDGLLRPTALRSTGDPCPPSVEDCPDCQAARRSRH